MSEKLEKSEKETEIICTHVDLFIGSGSDSGKYYCPIRPEAPGNDHFSEKNHNSFEKTIANTVDKIQNTVRKANKKQMDRNDGNLVCSLNFF